MSGAGKRPRARPLAIGLTSLAIVGAILAAEFTGPGPRGLAPAQGSSADVPGTQVAASSASSPDPSSPCGRASASTIAAVDATAAQGIYAGELSGSEVSADIAHVTGSQALLSALARNDRAAVYAAVRTIVYTPHWHIVRLRVARAGGVIADVGGPDVIAPVSGPLSFRGRTVGSYVMSVQDDAGYVKLVSRFIGVPIDLYRNGAFLMGTLQPRACHGNDWIITRSRRQRVRHRCPEHACVPERHAARRAARRKPFSRPGRHELCLRAARGVGVRCGARRGPLEPFARSLPRPRAHPAWHKRRSRLRALRLDADRRWRGAGAAPRSRPREIRRALMVALLLGAGPANTRLLPDAPDLSPTR